MDRVNVICTADGTTLRNDRSISDPAAPDFVGAERVLALPPCWGSERQGAEDAEPPGRLPACAICRVTRYQRPEARLIDCRGTVAHQTYYTAGPTVEVSLYVCEDCLRQQQGRKFQLWMSIEDIQPREG